MYDHRAGEVVRPANGEPVSGAEQPVVPNDARPAVVPDAQLLDSVIIQNLKGVTELTEFERCDDLWLREGQEETRIAAEEGGLRGVKGVRE